MYPFVLGLVLGIGITVVCFRHGALSKRLSWYHWVLVALGVVMVAFAFEVLLGSLAEYESRAALLGFAIFFSVGAGLLLLVWKMAPLSGSDKSQRAEPNNRTDSRKD